MKNVIILNLKSTFLPDCIMQLDENKDFLENSHVKEKNSIPYFDPVAVKAINEVVKLTNAEIVISDGWYWTEQFDITKHWCKKNGLKIKFYQNHLIPKLPSGNRIQEIQNWIDLNQNNHLLLIIDEDYTMKNLVSALNNENFMREQYKDSYQKYLGTKRRKSLIPKLEYLRYEHFSPRYNFELDKLICIHDKNGLTQEVIKEVWRVIKNK